MSPRRKAKKDRASNNSATLELAAAKLTEHLKPQNATVYTDKPVGELLLKNKIRPEPQGDVEILRMFWNFEIEWPHKNMVAPLLTYADLLATGEARNIENARILLEPVTKILYPLSIILRKNFPHPGMTWISSKKR